MSEHESKKCVLVCDDEPLVCELTETILTQAGYRVLTIGTGKEAIDILIDGLVPNLILIDERLPDMTGRDLRQVISKMLPEVRIAYFTGAPEQNADGTPTLFKPFDPQTLLNTVRQLLN